MNTQPAPGGGIQHIALPIEHVLARSPGVVEVFINLDREMAYICYDPAQCDPEHLAALAKRARFGSQNEWPNFLGVSSAACEAGVTANGLQPAASRGT